MSVRSQLHIINPASACPPDLIGPNGNPKETVSFDISDVAHCAWSEVVQTAPRSMSLAPFFEDLLEPGTSLTWKGKGPGLGTEMRRSFSGLFGRFFARAYLQIHHGFVWFAAIDGNMFQPAQNWRIIKKPGSRTEMPDWICAKPGVLAIGEAKGSHQNGDAVPGSMPGPIKTAEGQIKGVLVQKLTTSGRSSHWQSRSVKGWAVMSRWGLANPMRSPFLYALDPKTEGGLLTIEELQELEQAVARTHIEQTAGSLGVLNLIDRVSTPTLLGRVGIHRDIKMRSFLGTIVTPFGTLDLDLDQARLMSEMLPNPDLVRFVGLEERMLNNYLKGENLVHGKRERVNELSIVGSDGLVVAPIQQIVGLG